MEQVSAPRDTQLDVAGTVKMSKFTHSSPRRTGFLNERRITSSGRNILEAT
jgi:hypothetical protein